MVLAVYGALFTLSLHVLGFVRNRRDAVTLWVVAGLGATFGAMMPWLVSGQPVLSGVGLPVGLVTSRAVFLTGRALVAHEATRFGDVRAGEAR